MPLNIESDIKIDQRNAEDKEENHLKLVCKARFKLISLSEINGQSCKRCWFCSYLLWTAKES